ncbi:toll/interleukin-1 receptor domain-containing protein [Rhizobium lentis]|uniref:toll/interleukin-1 receptor domain-containing protein n=1 Tax=Rhizobium lentis TaxID=1138194 RepID=UPI001C8334B0|nr:toll/interleukin-1 receptor domain-containing protein [Rhizobium lentis]MBX5131269.1 toll/interleukin-1 receptor domain-containing protein [Rhizobium lentis]
MDLDSVFISHAKPEDNEFVRWLGARLTGVGFKVWAELLDSSAGTPFWADIETVIRERAVKTLSVVSTHSVKADRRGFRNELAMADARGRKLDDRRFIIPLKLDQVSHDAFPAELAQLHYVDFSDSWGNGFLELVSTLERLGVQKFAPDDDGLFEQWRAISEQLPNVVEIAPEPALTNLVTVVRPPERVQVFSFDGDPGKFFADLKKSEIPHVPFHRLVITFADLGHLATRMPSHYRLCPHSDYTLVEFLDGTRKGATRPEKADAKNMVTRMLRESIELHLRSRGLREYSGSTSSAFYFPESLAANNKVYYDAAFGKRTWKGVVGRSQKLQVNWHLAMKVNVVVSEAIVVRFKPYICWSEDGRTPIHDAKRTAKLRRQFCKSWWNPHWRALQEAFIAFLANDKPTIEVELGTTNTLALDRQPLSVELARRMPSDLKVVDQPDDPDEPDDLDEYEDLVGEASEEDEDQ